MATKQTPTPPPYISFKTLLKLLERMRQTHLLTRVDRRYLTEFSSGYQSQIIAALRWLDLIGEEGDVTGTLALLAQNPDVRPRVVGELLRSHYPAVFVLSSRNGTQRQLEEEFRSYGINGSTLRSAIAFFLNAARFAEIPVSPHFKVPQDRSSRSNRKASPRNSRTTSRAETTENELSKPLRTSGLPTADMRTRYLDMLLKKAESQDEMDSGLLDRIETLLGYDAEPQK